MELREAIKLALQSLWQNKLRTFLTLLGVMIGVASVIAVVTLVNGANTYVTTKFSRYGADVFTVSKNPALVRTSGQYEKLQHRKNVTYDDYIYVRDNCKRCVGIGAQQATVAKVTRETNSITDTSIRGYTWQMPSLQNLDIAEGRGFTSSDDEHASSVAIIGSDIRDNLFPGIDPLGQELRVDGQPYTVIGVGEKQGSTFGQSQDNWVGIPLSAFQKTYGASKTLTIYAKAGSAGSTLEAAGDEVRVLMRARRHDAPGADDSFELDANGRPRARPTRGGLRRRRHHAFGVRSPRRPTGEHRPAATPHSRDFRFRRAQQRGRLISTRPATCPARCVRSRPAGTGRHGRARVEAPGGGDGRIRLPEHRRPRRDRDLHRDGGGHARRSAYQLGG